MGHRPSRDGRRVRSLTRTVLAITVMALLASGCAGAASTAEKTNAITIAYQPGLGYAPLLIAKQEKLLEKRMPDVDITWRELDSGSAIRDGVVSGDIHIAAGGAGPFLVGYDAGVGWRTLMSLGNMELRLMAKDPTISSLHDLNGQGKIAMPAPDSIQSVVLRKAASEQLGDPKVLDSQIVSMEHPDGVQALLAGQIDAHLTSPPFQGDEADAGAHEVLNSYDLFGEHTFNSLYATTDFAETNGQFVDALLASTNEGIRILNENPQKAAQILSKESGGQESPAELTQQITSGDVEFTAEPQGFGKFAAFMTDIGMIQEEPATEDLFFDNQYTKGAS